MKLMDADKVIADIDQMLIDVQKHSDIVDAKDDAGNDIVFKLKTMVNRNKEKDGSFNIVIELRRAGVKDWKCIVVYFAEHSHGITTLVVNGILHNIIFENSTMTSPNALLTYLPEIILSDVRYLKECKPVKSGMREKPFNKPRKSFSERRKYRVSRNGSSYRTDNSSEGKYVTKGNNTSTKRKSSLGHANYKKKEY